MNRKLSALGAVCAVTFALAACSSGGGGGTGTSAETGGGATTSAGTETTAAGGTSTQVEVFTWWATGGEQLGLNALVDVFNKQHPEVEFINGAVAGGAGSQAKDLLQTRMQTGNPPDTFQAHAGKELQDYIDAGQVEDITDLYSQWGLDKAFPQSLLDMLTNDGKIYSVPANIHRANMLWANPQVMTEAGLDPANPYFDSMADFIAALQKVKDAGKIGLAVGTTWTQTHLLENVLLSDLGADAYKGLWDGTTDWTSADVTKALTDYQTLIGFTNTDRDGIDDSEVSQLVIDGKAAFYIMGDWNIAVYDAQGILDSDHLVYAPAPGTKGTFDFLADSFTLPVGAPHPDGAKAWLETVGSVDGQVAFNTKKGSIPARADADPSQFPTYQQETMKDFAADTIVPSLMHGAATPTAQLNAIQASVSKFTTGALDLAGFQAELAADMAS
jgi:glucose/mannose transport system substrate-binding protein